jgi:sterol desaturase/sphingolipid hydroxylase (fatty acid hydroxylase superfamily)
MGARRVTVAAVVTVVLTTFAVSATVWSSWPVVAGVVAAFVVLTPVERRFGTRRSGGFRAGTGTDLAHLFVNRSLIWVSYALLVAGPLVALRPVHDLGLVDPLPAWAEGIVWLVVAFVANYWGHRLSHELPLLWRLHRVHHSSTHLDWLATVRQHPVDAAFTQVVTLAPLYALGFSERSLLAAGAAFTALAVLQHLDLPWSFGPLRWVVPSPRWHHWHHATDPAARDRHFGVPLVDLLFGTAYFPRGGAPAGYGTDELPGDIGYLASLVSPVRSRTGTFDRSS